MTATAFSAKNGWNIWHIKNRWLRAVVAWPMVAITAVAMLIVIAGATILFALKGAWDAVADGYSDGFGVSDRKEWAGIVRAAWCAITAQDEPK
jgi:hypothetical protein